MLMRLLAAVLLTKARFEDGLLAERYGERFTPPASVVAMAEAGGVYR